LGELAASVSDVASFFRVIFYCSPEAAQQFGDGLEAECDVAEKFRDSFLDE
jgi:hypothetical protein